MGFKANGVVGGPPMMTTVSFSGSEQLSKRLSLKTLSSNCTFISPFNERRILGKLDTYWEFHPMYWHEQPSSTRNCSSGRLLAAFTGVNAKQFQSQSVAMASCQPLTGFLGCNRCSYT